MKGVIVYYPSHTNVFLGNNQEMMFAGRFSVLESYEKIILSTSLINFEKQLRARSVFCVPRTQRWIYLH